MAFCGKTGVLWSVKAGMTETYYLFLRQCRLILPEMWGRVWAGERAVRISRNNLAHVKKTNRAKHVVDNVLPGFIMFQIFLLAI